MAVWNLTSLTELFASDPAALGDVDVTIPPEGDVIRVTLKEKGHLDVFVAAGGDPSAGAVQLAATEYVRAARRAGIDDEVALRYVRTALADS